MIMIVDFALQRIARGETAERGKKRDITEIQISVMSLGLRSLFFAAGPRANAPRSKPENPRSRHGFRYRWTGGLYPLLRAMTTFSGVGAYLIPLGVPNQAALRAAVVVDACEGKDRMAGASWSKAASFAVFAARRRRR